MRYKREFINRLLFIQSFAGRQYWPLFDAKSINTSDLFIKKYFNHMQQPIENLPKLNATISISLEWKYCMYQQNVIL